MLTAQPALKGAVSFLQIAVPSRCQIAAYGHLQQDLAKLVSEVNGRHSEVDWTPIRYLYKGYAQSTLVGFYRVAQVGLVTPFHDGMNLVAKEYVAAQNPTDPGVLVLSQFAGAAKELDAAVLVNPHDIDGMAQAIGRAWDMPLEERRARWNDMMGKLRNNTGQMWFEGFVKALNHTRSVQPILVPVAPAAAALTYLPDRATASIS
jgi:trehalose 6-phosphate synthase